MPIKSYRYLDIITIAFVTVLLLSNIIAVKIVSLGALALPAAVFLFPLSYIFGDILTEVYGYAKARRVIWTGLAANVFMALVFMAASALPPAAPWPLQEAFASILGQTPRIVAASVIAYWAGEFLNSYVLAKIKVKMQGRRLWIRTIGSTVVGEAIDTALFISLAFGGVLPGSLVITIMISSYLAKVALEIILTPATYAVVRTLKRAEGEDYYDTATNFNPFHLRDRSAAS
ncbi:MAG: hypothetical protein UY92_C0003G0052 [Candidatus Magasanikbacteria bacterium GW2011_GWA2_56_11]|uniref:Probable queuosine precursor transporter n=1 Tax=Candidatus Magasanikbacteria bacterium GW2011_GWA2_56_11 TaxID=1619044 RepID=A0A0G1YHY6_9BACT|nr:MAG: hypothetical protein UY92_C0003G0052 [Candidatus Magasanikbacteria bacterium GW2011_GWA2_56_11]